MFTLIREQKLESTTELDLNRDGGHFDGKTCSHVWTVADWKTAGRPPLTGR